MAFSTFTEIDPTPSGELAAGRIAGQDALLVRVGSILQDEAERQVNDQESVLLPLVRRMVSGAIERIDEQRSLLQSLLDAVAGNAISRVTRGKTLLHQAAETFAGFTNRIGADDNGRDVGWHCVFDSLTGEYCTKEVTRDARLLSTDIIQSGPWTEEREAASDCRSRAEAIEDATILPPAIFGGPAVPPPPPGIVPPIAVPPPDIGRPVPPVPPELPIGPPSPPIRPPSPPTTPSGLTPRPSPPALCPPPNRVGKDTFIAEDVGYYDFLSADGIMAVLGLPPAHPRRQVARAYLGPDWYAAFDSETAEELAIALKMGWSVGRSPWTTGPRQGTAERMDYSRIPGD